MMMMMYHNTSPIPNNDPQIIVSARSPQVYGTLAAADDRIRFEFFVYIVFHSSSSAQLSFNIIREYDASFARLSIVCGSASPYTRIYIYIRLCLTTFWKPQIGIWRVQNKTHCVSEWKVCVTYLYILGKVLKWFLTCY